MQIETLVEDIERVLTTPTTLDKLAYEAFGVNVASLIERSLSKDEDGRGLRMSNIGTPCVRQLQYKLDPTIEGEALPANAYFKFMYGHLIEELILLLAREAGHEVVGEQTELEIEGIKGHRDAIIDGVLVDVKSAATLSFQRFKNHLRPSDDHFGYIPQLSCYHFASRNDRSLKDHERAAFLVVDKQLGHICLDIHGIDTSIDWAEIIRERKRVVNSGQLATRAYFDEPEGRSGNRKLGTNCSYCAFKTTCWPNLRTFIYAKGPVFLTHVTRLPEVPELGVAA